MIRNEVERVDVIGRCEQDHNGKPCNKRILKVTYAQLYDATIHDDGSFAEWLDPEDGEGDVT